MKNAFIVAKEMLSSDFFYKLLSSLKVEVLFQIPFFFVDARTHDVAAAFAWVSIELHSFPNELHPFELHLSLPQ